MKQLVILVDENDNKIDTEEKLKAHKKGLLHRAFSVFVFNNKNELLMQKRAERKYHSGGLWTNTCCSHPAPDESTENAAHRRLREEMGFDCRLKEVFSFTYKVSFGNGLIEHELDHVYVGKYNKDPKPNPKEVNDYKWISLENLKAGIENNPDKYTYWAKEIINNHISKLDSTV